MEHFYYPGPGIFKFGPNRKENWNQLRSSTPAKSYFKNNSFSNQFQSFNNSKFSTIKILPKKNSSVPKPSGNPASTEKILTMSVEVIKTSRPGLRSDKNRQNVDYNKEIFDKNVSVLTFDELMLLEHDLFSEKQYPKISTQKKQPLSDLNDKITRRVIGLNGKLIELNGKKMKFFSYKNSTEKSSEKLVRPSIVITKRPILTSRRSFSVNKSPDKYRKNDAPSPWGIEKNLDKDTQKVIISNCISVTDKFTWT
jgi:hypothetical protein